MEYRILGKDLKVSADAFGQCDPAAGRAIQPEGL